MEEFSIVRFVLGLIFGSVITLVCLHFWGDRIFKFLDPFLKRIGL